MPQDTIGKLVNRENIRRVLPQLYDQRNGESRRIIISYIEDLGPDVREEMRELRYLVEHSNG